MKKKQNYAWAILVGIILIRGFAGSGINMTASLFLKPVSDELGIGIGTLSIYFSIASIVMILWLPIAGKLIGRYDIRIIVPIAAALQALSFAAFGLLNNVIGWYLLAIPQTLGSTIVVNLLGPIMINRWFTKNTGLILGIQMAFVWLFAAVLQPLTSNIIATNGWRNGYFFIGIITFIVVILTSILLLRDHPSSPEDNKSKNNDNIKNNNAIEISEEVASRSASFLMLLVFMIAVTGTAVFTQHLPTYGTLVGYPLNKVGIVMSLSSIGSAVGSIAIGFISDRIGGLKTCFVIIFLWVLAVVGIFLSNVNFLIFAVASFLHGVSSSSVAIIAPILTLMFYGNKDYEKIYAKVTMGAPIASILLIPVYGYIYDSTGSYLAVLIMLIVLLFVAGVSIIVGWKYRCTAAGCPVFRKRNK